MQNTIHSYTMAIHGNTRAINHIPTVNHWSRELVCQTSDEYTTFVTGREMIKNFEGYVVANDRGRSVTSALQQAAKLLATLKYVSEVAFK
jgi:hypothetical protein